MTYDDPNLTLIKELIKNDVIVLVTGCAAMTCGKAGLLCLEAARKYAGEGLASVCEAVGIPPVLHMKPASIISRILVAATAVVKAGGLGDRHQRSAGRRRRSRVDELKRPLPSATILLLRAFIPFSARPGRQLAARSPNTCLKSSKISRRGNGALRTTR